MERDDEQLETAPDVEEVEYSDEPTDASEWEEAYPDPEPQSTTGGLFSTPARMILLVVSILLLFLVTGTVAWLLGSKSAANQSANAAIPAQGSTLQPGVTYNYSSNGPAPKVGSPAPDFTLTDADTGQPVTLSSLKGKPVWINFWATWCHACIYEMPDMKKVYDEYKDKGLVILGVDDDEPREDVNAFTKQYGYDWTFLLDPGGSTTFQYRVEAIPTHWFVGKDGILKAVQIGALPENFIKDNINKIID